jgi:hypothetical protein
VAQDGHRRKEGVAGVGRGRNGQADVPLVADVAELTGLVVVREGRRGERRGAEQLGGVRNFTASKFTAPPPTRLRMWNFTKPGWVMLSRITVMPRRSTIV